MALSGIGDALMFTPALRLLKQNLPDTEISALVMFKGAEDILKNNPCLDRVIRFDFLKEGAFKSLLFLLKLRKTYDASVNVYPSNRKEYNLISFLIGAKQRAAVDYLRMNKANLGWLNNLRVLENDSTHNVMTNIALVSKLLKKNLTDELPMEIFLSEEDISFSEKYLADAGINKNELVIGFHPGCATLKNHSKRRWETEKFAGLGKRLITQKDARILIFGGHEEDELKESIFNSIRSERARVVKTNSLSQTAAVMKRCDLFITNDSSLMHVASALKLKVVAIIGPTNTAYIHPWKTNHEIVSLNLDCAPCFYYSPKPLACSRKDVEFKCIKELSTEMVYSAADKMLNLKD
ncbi:MAG: glycosyltransferase family 9 protein [Ignavibacteriaceae bacterium]|nr:glycosyltransferase family 9 protein [Ignavibacteriaceae bacterium]